jgi:hypothetical protein
LSATSQAGAKHIERGARPRAAKTAARSTGPLSSLPRWPARRRSRARR